MTPEQRIVSDLAKATGERIARQVRVATQRMTAYRLSGDDSPLKNTWDELCVQVQFEESYAWCAYEATVEAIVRGCVESLPRHELEALWFQTEAGIESRDEDEERVCSSERRPAVRYEDVTAFIITNYVYPLAEKWTNPRIRGYLDGTD